MNNTIKAIVRISFFIIFCVNIISCGHRQSPTGGKKDTVNPEILAIIPGEFEDINGQDIEVTFSKPIDRTTILSGLYIYPAILKKKFKWEGNTLIIRILEELEQDTNYYFSFSSRIKGEHDNNLNRDYLYVFRSGKLNNNRISGLITYEKQEDADYNLKLKLMSSDSTLIYQTELEDKFSYQFDNLNSQDHIIEAYVDKNKDNKYNYGKEPYYYNYITKAKISTVPLEFAYSDTIKPEIKSAKVISSSQVELTLSEPASGLTQVEIFTADSLQTPLNIIAYSLRNDKINLITSIMDTLKYNLRILDLEDYKDNCSDQAEIFFDGTSKADSLAPVVVSASPRNGASVNSLLPDIEVEFSEIIMADQIQAKLVEVESGAVTGLNMVKKDSEHYLFVPKQKLNNYSSYRFMVVATDVCGNKMKEDFELVFIPIIRN